MEGQRKITCGMYWCLCLEYIDSQMIIDSFNTDCILDIIVSSFYKMIKQIRCASIERCKDYKARDQWKYATYIYSYIGISIFVYMLLYTSILVQLFFS